MKLGHVMRKWRLMSERSLRDVCDELKISAPTLMRIEQGKLMDAPTLAKVLGWLMETGEPRQAPPRAPKREIDPRAAARQKRYRETLAELPKASPIYQAKQERL
jgi:transcriptional regulator with XRE-family HTH domain